MSDSPASGTPRDVDGFLAQAGWGRAERRMLAGDASFRKYYRLTEGTRVAVLMDAPPPQEDVRPFARIARHLDRLGFSAPRILAEDAVQGFLLLEDFGDATYTRLLAAGADETALYALAVDLLVALHRHGDATRIEIPAYDDERLLNEAALLTDWYMPAIFGRQTDEAQRNAYLAAWRSVLPDARYGAPTLVLRDYHVDNLMVLKGRSGIAACGLLDFQDAVIGPAAYDLVSLLEDARRDVPADLAAAMMTRYLDAFAMIDAAKFRAAYAILGAQRNAKIIGIFTRLMARDKKPHYLRHVPRVWRLLESDLAHPALTPVRDWFARVLPPEKRIVPSTPSA